jgi:hypothetical protein
MRKSNIRLNEKLKLTLICSFFIFICVTHLHSEDIQCEWKRVERIVAVGDVHGDYDNFITILKQPEIKIIDDEGNWIGGKTHLVQIGDVMDRGNEAKRIFDFLKRLEKEAEAAEGKVHVLIGNHEELNIINRAFEFENYVTVEQFLDFIPNEYRQKREKRIRRKIDDSSLENTNSDSNLHPEIRLFWEDRLKNARQNRKSEAQTQYYKGFIKRYGEWILGFNVVIKINNIIFVHGGISLRNSKKTLKYINERTRLELRESMYQNLGKRPPRTTFRRLEFLYDANSPLWYREYATQEEDVFKDIVTEILNNLKADHIVTAHTPIAVDDVNQMSRYDKRIWIIDTSISDAYEEGGALSALIIEDYGKKIVPWWMSRNDKKQRTSVEYSKQIQEIHWIIHFGMPPFPSYCLNSKDIKKDIVLWGEINEI